MKETGSSEKVAQQFKELKKYFFIKQIRYFGAYFQVVSSHLSEDLDHLQSKFKEINKGRTPPKKDDEKAELELQNEIWGWQGFTNLQRHSFIVFLYSYFESAIRRDAEIRGKRLSPQINVDTELKKYKDMSFCEKIERLYTDHFDSLYDFSSDEWTWLKGFSKLRNCIVHQQGDLIGWRVLETKIKRDVIDFVSRNDGLTLMGSKESIIAIEREFCQEALLRFEKTLVQVIFET